MNKRDFIKAAAALSLAPAIPVAGTPRPAFAASMAGALPSLPTPSYVYDSVRRTMRFYRADDTSRMMHAYFARG